MDYAKIYGRLIERAKCRRLSCYTERHHVLPRCLGGDDSPQNIVELTAEEHFIAHKLLVQMHPDNPRVAFALLAMSRKTGGHRQNNKLFGWARRRVARAIGQMKAGVPRSPETVAKIAAGNRGRKHCPEEIEKRRAALTGMPKTPEHAAKVSAALKGRHDIGMAGHRHTEETKAKMRRAATGRMHTDETIAKLTARAASETQEQRSARAHKAWQTKRANGTATKRSRGNADTPQTRKAIQPALDV